MKKRILLFSSLIGITSASSIAILSASCAGDKALEQWKASNLKLIEEIKDESTFKEAVKNPDVLSTEQKRELATLISKIEQKQKEIANTKDFKKSNVKKQIDEITTTIQSTNKNYILALVNDLKENSESIIKTFLRNDLWEKENNSYSEEQQKEHSKIFVNFLDKTNLTLKNVLTQVYSNLETKYYPWIIKTYKENKTTLVQYQAQLEKVRKDVAKKSFEALQKEYKDLQEKIEKAKENIEQPEIAKVKETITFLMSKFDENIKQISGDTIEQVSTFDIKEKVKTEVENLLSAAKAYKENSTKVEKVKKVVDELKKLEVYKETNANQELKSAVDALSSVLEENDAITKLNTALEKIESAIKEYPAKLVREAIKKELETAKTGKYSEKKMTYSPIVLGEIINQEIDKIEKSYEAEKDFSTLLKNANYLTTLNKVIPHAELWNNIFDILEKPESKMILLDRIPAIETIEAGLSKKFKDAKELIRNLFAKKENLKQTYEELKKYLEGDKWKSIEIEVQKVINRAKLNETLNKTKQIVNEKVEQQFSTFKEELKTTILPNKASVVEENIGTLIRAQKNVYEALFKNFEEPLANVNFDPKDFPLLAQAISDTSLLINEITIDVMTAAFKTNSNEYSTKFLEDALTPEVVKKILDKVVVFFKKNQSVMVKAFKGIFNTFLYNESLKKDNVTRIKEIVDISVKYYEEEVPKLIKKIEDQNITHLSIGDFEKLKLELAPILLMFDELWKGHHQKMHTIYQSNSQEMKAINREFDKSRLPIIDAAKQIASQVLSLGNSHIEFYYKCYL